MGILLLWASVECQCRPLGVRSVGLLLAEVIIRLALLFQSATNLNLDKYFVLYRMLTCVLQLCLRCARVGIHNPGLSIKCACEE